VIFRKSQKRPLNKNKRNLGVFGYVIMPEQVHILVNRTAARRCLQRVAVGGYFAAQFDQMLTSDSAHFLRETVVDIDAAVVGISSSRWTTIPIAEATTDEAARIMSDYRFDILPVKAADGVKEYFHTKDWDDYSTVIRERITHRDVISFATPLRDVIQGFALKSRHFYFLGNERRIVGLISVANLNCRQVRVYLFSLLSELEIELGKLISDHCEESELLKLTFGTDPKPKYEDVKKRYNLDKANGIDIPVVEYLYLSDMISLIRKKKLFVQLGYQSAGKFDDAFNSLVELRNAVAHPTRSLIVDSTSCNKLWERIDRIEEALFHLR
jgi:CBS domain-containing protein